MSRLLRPLPLLAASLLLALAACGEDAAPAEEAPEATCACPEDVCAPGECVLVVQIDPGCEAVWGEASVYLHDISSSAEPVGTVTVEQPFRTCDPLPSGEPFTFIVESQDGRRVSPSGPFTCAGDQPFVFSASCQ